MKIGFTQRWHGKKMTEILRNDDPRISYAVTRSRNRIGMGNEHGVLVKQGEPHPGVAFYDKDHNFLGYSMTKEEQWQDDNQEAIEQYNEHIEKNGVFSENVSKHKGLGRADYRGILTEFLRSAVDAFEAEVIKSYEAEKALEEDQSHSKETESSVVSDNPIGKTVWVMEWDWHYGHETIEFDTKEEAIAYPSYFENYFNWSKMTNIKLRRETRIVEEEFEVSLEDKDEIEQSDV